jgi:hypothetical protein
MTPPIADIDATLDLARCVVEVLRAHGADAVVIGAVAMAVHRYPRDTVDLDLATAIDPETIESVARALRTLGFDVEVYAPDGGDPLGGVMDVRAPDADLVQIVNFLNPPAGGFPRLVADASVGATALTPGSPLRVVDLPTLIAFKLYAGGPKSRLDILELLDRNPELDMQHLRARCAAYRLEDELDKVLALQRD